MLETLLSAVGEQRPQACVDCELMPAFDGVASFAAYRRVFIIETNRASTCFDGPRNLFSLQSIVRTPPRHPAYASLDRSNAGRGNPNG